MQGLHYNLDAMFPEKSDFYEEEEIRDYEYLKRLYPRQIRLIASILEEYLDRYEYEGSPMFAQYPDAVTIYRMTEEIYNKLSFDGEDFQQMKDLIQIMVCQEFLFLI